MSGDIDIRSAGWRRALDVVGVVLCVLVDTAVVYAVFESPFGTLVILDDTPPEGYVLVPVLAGAVLGALQRIAFGTASAVVGAILLALGGAVSLFFVFPAGFVAAGCVLGAVAALPIPRRTRGRGSVLALVALVVAGTLAAGYGLTRTDPAEHPLLEVTTVSGGPSIVVDPQRRAYSETVTGTLADVGGCLGLVDSSTGNGSFVVAWERGTTAASGTYALVYRGRSYSLGDHVVVTGPSPLTSSADLEGYARDLPTSCRGLDLLLAG